MIVTGCPPVTVNDIKQLKRASGTPLEYLLSPERPFKSQDQGGRCTNWFISVVPCKFFNSVNAKISFVSQDI